MIKGDRGNQSPADRQNEICFKRWLVVSQVVGTVVFSAILLVVFREHLDKCPCPRWCKEIAGTGDKLLPLTLASMTLAALLLTTKLSDNRYRELVLGHISVLGIPAVFAVVKLDDWGVFIFMLLGILPASLAFGLVFFVMFNKRLWLLVLLIPGVVLVPLAIYLDVVAKPIVSDSVTFLMAVVGILFLIIFLSIYWWIGIRKPSGP